MSEEPGKVTPQDSHKWMGNTFGVKGVKCTTQNERKCEPKRGKGLGGGGRYVKKGAGPCPGAVAHADVEPEFHDCCRYNTKTELEKQFGKEICG